MSLGQRHREEIRRGKPLERKAGLKAGKALERKTRMKPVNRKRKQSEFARCYGSKARVEWVKSLRCEVCRARPSENAHTATGGTGRKADADTIVALCRICHLNLHAFGRETFERVTGITLTEAARRTEEAWQNHITNEGE